MSNYTELERKFIKDIECTAKIYRHDPTGARIVIIPAEDNHRAVSIAFSTPAENDKGIPHIIEHSVFCGSKKYPLKDPFVEMMKGSMYTFLNAMTYRDFTLFPVASTNEADFHNLMDVYLDAVFHPLMPEKKEVFLQEGWNYDIGEDGTVSGYNGVVYNEMRGMQGSADFLLEDAVIRALYPDSPYQFESGGLPVAITTLSYKEVCAYYHAHYHPTNCLIFLYGNVDEEETLTYLHREYLSAYERGRAYHVPALDRAGSETETKAPYPVDDAESAEKGYYFSYTFSLPGEHTPLLSLTMQVLDRVLCSSEGAYLKEKLYRTGIGEEFYSILDDQIRYPYFGFVSAYCYEEQKQQFQDIIDGALLDLVQNGIDKERLRSALRNLEFRQREADYGNMPRGISHAVQLLPGLLYQENDPLGQLAFLDAIDELKALAETDYFEQFIRKHFVENRHKALVTLVPDASFAEREEDLLWTQCCETIQKEDFDVLLAEHKKLDAYRNLSDSPKLAEKIPVLDRRDLMVKPNRTPTEHIEGLLYQEKNTNGIAYFDFMFDLRYLSPELMPYVRIFMETFGSMSTRSHTYPELSDLIDNYTGGIFHDLQIIDASMNGGQVVPYLFWHSRFLYHNKDQVSQINREILLETDFADEEHLYDMLLMMKAAYTREMLDSADMTAKKIGLCACSTLYAYEDMLQGYSFYQFLAGLIDDYDYKKQELISSLEAIRKGLLDPTCWKFSFVGERKFLADAGKFAADFRETLARHQTQAHRLHDPASPGAMKNRAYYLSSQVQYTALCGKMPEEAVKKRGIFLVLEHLLSTEYLWQNLRVLGGAYGASASFDFSGEVSMTSFRDPNLDETFDCYQNVIRFIQDLTLTERQLRQFVIGAMNRLDRPKTPYMEGMTQIQTELCKISDDQVLSIRQQIISATMEDIRSVLPYLEDYMKNARRVVIGSEQKIRASACSFDTISPLL